MEELSFGSAVAAAIFLINPATGELVEADTLFDANRSWTTYAGPLRTDTGGNVIYDFHRVRYTSWACAWPSITRMILDNPCKPL